MNSSAPVESKIESDSYPDLTEVDSPQSVVYAEDCGYCGEIHGCGYCGEIHEDDIPEPIEPSEFADIPFDNGEWLPVKPEPEDSLYWWSFPWIVNWNPNLCPRRHRVYNSAVWKLVAGKKVTHLPEMCLNVMTPTLACKLFHGRRNAPYTVHLDPKYESVLDVFTERMLDLDEDVPQEKLGLLNNLFDETGYIFKNGHVPL